VSDAALPRARRARERRSRAIFLPMVREWNRERIRMMRGWARRHSWFSSGGIRGFQAEAFVVFKTRFEFKPQI
jgi:hypothetical protein